MVAQVYSQQVQWDISESIFILCTWKECHYHINENLFIKHIHLIKCTFLATYSNRCMHLIIQVYDNCCNLSTLLFNIGVSQELTTSRTDQLQRCLKIFEAGVLRWNTNLSAGGVGGAPPDADKNLRIVWHKIIRKFTL